MELEARKSRFYKIVNYLSSTLAPASSSCFLAASASSLLAPSLRTDGVPSTASLASLRPRPVKARTTLITSIFLAPLSTRTMLKSVFSSAASAAPPYGGHQPHHPHSVP